MVNRDHPGLRGQHVRMKMISVLGMFCSRAPIEVIVGVW